LASHRRGYGGKIKPEDLRLNIAAMAVMTYILADMPEKLTTVENAQ